MLQSPISLTSVSPAGHDPAPRRDSAESMPAASRDAGSAVADESLQSWTCREQLSGHAGSSAFAPQGILPISIDMLQVLGLAS